MNRHYRKPALKPNFGVTRPRACVVTPISHVTHTLVFFLQLLGRHLDWTHTLQVGEDVLRVNSRLDALELGYIVTPVLMLGVRSKARIDIAWISSVVTA